MLTVIAAAEDIALDAQTLSTTVESTENPAHEDTEMRIDEEGRPVFKPAKQSVRYISHLSSILTNPSF